MVRLVAFIVAVLVTEFSFGSFRKAYFRCDVLCQRQCEVLVTDAGGFGSFDSCTEECVEWKKTNCQGFCRVLDAPRGQKAVDYENTPNFVMFRGGTLSLCLSYDKPVFVAVALFSEDMSKMWWLTKDCLLSPYYLPFMAWEKQNLCSDVSLPVKKGWLMWVASYGDVFNVDWSRDSYTFYSLHFSVECTQNHPENCSSRDECERVGGHWCFEGCQETPCRDFSCVEDCYDICGKDAGCVMECNYTKSIKCGFFSCALSCSELCGKDVGCRNSCAYWQELNCSYKGNFVCDLPCMLPCNMNWGCIEACLSWTLRNCFIDFGGDCLGFCRLYSAGGPPELRDRCLSVCEEYKRESSTLHWLGGVVW